MEPKYKNGDPVVVLRCQDNIQGMIKFIGRRTCVLDSERDNTAWFYTLEGCEDYRWREDWLQAIEPEASASVAPEPELDPSEKETEAEKFVRPLSGLIASDDELLIVFQVFLANLKEATSKGRVVAFLPEDIILPDEKINGENFLFEPKEVSVELPEALRLLGATIYHLVAGKSEFTHESFILDGYRRPLNSSLWPLVVTLLNGEAKSLEEVERMLDEIDPVKAVQNIQPVPLVGPITSPKIRLATDIIRGLAGEQIKIIDHEKVAKFWGIVVPQNVEIRYDEQTLRESIEANRNGEQWALAYCTGQSIRQMRQKIGTNSQPCFWNNDWWLKSKEDYWANKTLEPGYYLLNFNGKFGDEDWDTQGRHITELGPMFERCHEFLVSEAVFSNFNIHNGERLLENWYHWGQELDSDGDRVFVGGFGSGGFRVGHYSPGESNDYLRVVVARKFDA